ncbi:MAG: DUF262 domain-containing protein [Nitrospirae bacterium]|nr:DUF262 domain-containing protein [Nitrospirota bacterium]
MTANTIYEEKDIKPKDNNELDNDVDDKDNDVDNTDNDDDSGDDRVKYEIDYYPSDLTLAEYHRKWEKKTLVIPDFQQRYVWTKNDASKLIESFLIGLPVPGVFLYKRRGDNKFLVVDGQQRILSGIYFIEGMFEEGMFKNPEFRLQNVRSKWNNKTFNGLDESDQLRIENSILRATIIQQLDPKDDISIYHIFERLNTGSEKLYPMEVRRCVYSGAFSGKLEMLNKIEAWRKLIGKPSEDQRYIDVEWILRVLAFAVKLTSYEKPMKRFLTDFMRDNNLLDNEELKRLTNDFEAVCKKVLELLGEKPFHIKQPLNYAVLDSVLSTLLKAGINAIADNLSSRYNKLIENEEYLSNVSMNTSDTASVEARFALASKILLTE